MTVAQKRNVVVKTGPLDSGMIKRKGSRPMVPTLTLICTNEMGNLALVAGLCEIAKTDKMLRMTLSWNKDSGPMRPRASGIYLAHTRVSQVPFFFVPTSIALESTPARLAVFAVFHP